MEEVLVDASDIKTMNLSKIARQIQYQTAKVEVIESMVLYYKKHEQSLEYEISCNIITALRKTLFENSEACIDCDSTSKATLIQSLREAIVYTNNYLVQMNSGIGFSDESSLFIKTLLNDITSSLLGLNVELGNILDLLNVEKIIDNKLQEKHDLNKEDTSQFSISDPPQQSKNLNSPSSSLDKIKLLWSNLLAKCLGDSDKAERLIQYEKQKDPKLDKEEAIQAAIHRWEKDNR